MIDHIGLLPLYLAAGTAVLVLVADLLLGRVVVTLGAGVLGALATAAGSAIVGAGGARRSFCVETGCSWTFDGPATLLAVAVATIAALVLLLSAPTLTRGDLPTGEYAFLLAASMTGGVALGGARDLITLIVALETLTLPLYVLVGMRRKSPESAQAAVTFLLTSVAATAVTLLGAALMYAATGQVHFRALSTALDVDGPGRPLAGAGLILLLVGVAFKVAAVPAHAWAPTTYDGGPVPIAAYLSTASKLGGLVAIVYAVVLIGPAWTRVTGPVLGVVAAATLLVGTLVALRQQRMVRLLAWSSVAQAGFMLAPLAAVHVVDAGPLVTATLAYALIYVTVELGAFAGVISLRPAGADGGTLDEYAGLGRTAPVRSAAYAFAVVGLAGLPPALAGLFAKVFVIRALVDAKAWFVVAAAAIAAVVGLAVYLRAVLPLYRDGEGTPAPRASIAVAIVLGVVTLAAVAAGFVPQLVLDLTTF
ncbi:MAG: NADH-quinone oxidoreductase subunit N [Hamadaea sp.]|nr:NADH-quinone oxidoreductase subunit N [Hamadaea sp.]